MSEHKDEEWLDQQLQRAVDGATPVFDAQAWKQKYADEYQTLTTRGRGAVGWGLPHRILPFSWLRWGKRHPTALSKLAIAAAVLVTGAVLFLVRFGSTPERLAPGSPRMAVESPAQIVSMSSLSAAFRAGGMEGLDRQWEQALKRLGPRPTSVSKQELLRDIDREG